ncbi:MAG TPA: 3-oxoacyl-[acyl-carrier-protein] reductase [Fimbriimonadaceae bacterium]|nr:3-oxoacyl-[acyl-carrier-protein] reductase [Fimbriimonadaceae bacterium]
MRFAEQVVVVTGASRGIGREIAAAFAAEGARVACLDILEEGAVTAANELGGGARGFACDVSSGGSVETAFDKVLAEMGTLAVLVNNAGIARDNLMLRMSEADWDKVLDVNLKGAFLCIKAASRPMMKARYGRILNLASVVGLHGSAGQANYSASKAGLVGLTMTVAKEFGSRGITCNAIAPGFIDTEMTQNLPAEFKEDAIKRAPAGRLGLPSDLAPAVLFLSSKEAGYITGQTLTIDGGLFL